MAEKMQIHSEKRDKTDDERDNLDDSNVVTMVDVLEQENELEKEYVAVLGASDEKCCTYSRVSVLPKCCAYKRP